MNGLTSTNPFDSNAENYDAWFDSLRGRAIFESELECLRALVTLPYRPWLEVGVGTGRFAQALMVEDGLEPSSAMLKFALQRGIRVKHRLLPSAGFVAMSFQANDTFGGNGS